MDTLPRTIQLQARAYPERELISVCITEETPAFYVGVQVSTCRYPTTVFPKTIWEQVEESEENVA